MALNHLFEITRFSSFLEALVENPEYRATLRRPVALLVEADQRSLNLKEWITFWDEPTKLVTEAEYELWRLLLDFTPDEMQVILRWLLDRTIREYGSGENPQGSQDALELLLIVLHELARDTPPLVLTSLVEQYLPLTKEPAMACDLYQWLFSFSFDPENPGMPSYLLAVQGLEKARQSGDRERIGYSAYNLVTYHSFHDAQEALTVLEDNLEYLADDRYYDALGNISLKILEERPTDRAIAYLETVWYFTCRTASEGSLAELRSIGFNLAYYGLNLAWVAYDNQDFARALKILDKLREILLAEREEFAQAAQDLGKHPVDWGFQYYAHLAETFLWSQASLEESGRGSEAQKLSEEFAAWRLTCPYDIESVVQEFFRDRDDPEA